MDAERGLIYEREKVVMNREKEMRTGIIEVLFTYIAWGFLPIFWKLLNEVASFYVLFSRALWSLAFCIVYLTVTKKWKRIQELFQDKNVVKRCLLSGILICINWGGYIWGVNGGHVLDCSLGYYLNPILGVVLGVLVFKEKLNKYEWTAVGLAIAGVLYLIIKAGVIPGLSLLLAGSFGTYGLIKKGLKISSDESLFMETVMVSPIAVIFLIYSEMNGIGAVGVLSGMEWLLLPLAGVVTAIPLLIYSAGVQKIPFYLAGMIMYLNPTIQFFLGIFLYKEPIDMDRIISFAIIWIGIIIMTVGNLKKNK